MNNPRYPHMQGQVVRLRSGLTDSMLSFAGPGVEDKANTLIAARSLPGDGTNVEDVKLRKVAGMAAGPAGPNGLANSGTQSSLMGLALLLGIAFVISRV